uniref:lipoprotein-releasing ABC transporter permease subunit LolC n=1 Tax=Thaumasiovibrio occultus TaxID=1891184 RepID=UPI000B3642B5|nr:lipoprotein-releasing ABC transporter permease subunit LolC [Thaumasiovibrio occultus]
MVRPVSFYIGWRYLRGRSGDRFGRFVSTMSMLGIMIGVAALITVLSVMNGFEMQLKGRFLSVLPHAVVVGEEPVAGTPPAFLSQYQGVERITPLTRSEAVLQSSQSLAAIDLLAVDPNEYEPLARYFDVGRLTDLQAGEYRIALGRSLAKQLGVEVGDRIRVMVTQASVYTPIGRIPSQRNFTVSGIFSSMTDMDQQLALVNIRDGGRLLRYQDGEFSGWRLFIDEPFSVPTLEKQPLEAGYQWTDWRRQRGELFQAVKMEKNMMSLMLGLIIAVAAFNIISSLIMVVMEKQSEVAILKTQGMRPRQVQAIFMFQGALSGIIGSILGAILGCLISWKLNSILHLIGASALMIVGELPVVIQPLQVMTILLVALLLSFLATLFPAYRASKLRPAETLRYE